MRAYCFYFMALLGLLLPSGLASAQLPQPGRNAMSVSLTAEAAEVAPGSTIKLALTMKPDRGWHGYWKNPGDAGAETRIKWTLPEGFVAGPLQYPVPDRLILAGLMNYVYERDYALLADLKVPRGIAAGTEIPISAKVDYLVCTNEVCVPEKADVSTSIRIAQATKAGPEAETISRYLAKLPKPLGLDARYQVEEGRIRIGIPFPADADAAGAYFYPLTERALLYSEEQKVGRSGDLLIIETGAAEAAGSLAKVEGVIRIGEGQGLTLTARPGTVPALDEGKEAGLILTALLGAIAGGLLLNIMPCVFPILSLKAISLAKAATHERTVRSEALAYTAGVVVVCLALGGALLAIRAGGTAVGWAFQLQDPRVILTLLLLTTVIALNLAGVFELRSFGGGDRLAGSGGTAGAFWTGALAAFVATPCTGPFMGVALGAALVLPTAAALAVFAGLGLGLALPFLLLGFIPALRRKLPKPGPWMNRFRRIMSIPMFLTAFGLAWILSRQAGYEALLVGLGAAALIAIALWLLGRGKARLILPLAGAAAAALLAILILPASSGTAVAASNFVLNAQPFDEDRLQKLRGEGRPVFVYFTADWCLTCKVNEKGVLDRDEVAQSFAAKNVAVLVGDWTRGDPAIGSFLEKHGRSGVPLYLYYPAGSEARVLPQILTPSQLTSL